MRFAKTVSLSACLLEENEIQLSDELSVGNSIITKQVGVGVGCT